jgi:hypothetical protein
LVTDNRSHRQAHSREVALPNIRQESIPLFHYPGFLGLRDLRNFVTLTQSPAVAPLLTRYRLLNLQFKFLSTKDHV